MTLDFRKYKNRFTEESVSALHFKGGENEILEIMDWVIDNQGRAQGIPNKHGELDLQIHERGVGFVTVTKGEWITKGETSGFEIYTGRSFTQMHEKVTPVIQVIETPKVHEAMQFTGDIENIEELTEWLKRHGHKAIHKHSIPGTTITYFRIEIGDGLGAIDIPLNDWILIHNKDLVWIPKKDFESNYQKVSD